METSARQALIMSAGELSIFFSSAVSTVLLVLALFVVGTAVYSGIKQRRKLAQF
jgi:TctA family transporter